jgi:hypothetical protein
MTRKVLSTTVALGLAIVTLSGAQSGPPGDGEIRATRDPSTNENLTTLTLMLSGPKGALPVNLVFTAVRGATASAVSSIRIDVNMPLFVGELDTKTPHVQFVPDRSTQMVTANVDASTVLPGRKFIQVPFDAARLKALASASGATGRVFGIDFVLTAKQMSAIKEFARQLR